jgi:hypothetical protein
MKSIIVISLLGALAYAHAQDTKPWFCHDLDCPTYKMVKNLTDINIEYRSYQAGKWASTVVTGVKYEKAVATGFWRLFKYISGNNEQQQKVEMTAPVTVKVTPAQGPFCEDNFTISFFVPFAFQDNPPKPFQEEVFIQEFPAMDVYVRSFGGWATGSRYLDAAADAIQALENAGYAIKTDYFFTAGYDSPFRLTNRHNEVWLLAAGTPSAAVERVAVA